MDNKIIDFYLSDFDESQLKKRGITGACIAHQYFIIQRGTIHIDILKACLKGDGITVFESNLESHFKKVFLDEKNNYKIIKFIPASGAASRMFSDLTLSENKEFFNNLKKFAFYQNLSDAFKDKGLDLNDAIDSKEYGKILDILLNEDGLNYLNLPKALIPFHIYDNSIKTAFEEHIDESKNFICDDSQKAHFHFTISEQHEVFFSEKLNFLKENSSSLIDVSFSYQSSSTETIAVDNDGNLVRDSKGMILFRPGGHGALLENINDIGKKYDLIMIKNIDNISVSKYHNIANEYFTLLSGYLIYVQKKIFSYLQKISSNVISEEDMSEIRVFCEKILFCYFSDTFEQKDILDQKAYLFSLLNRPLRVCGFVYNEKETGGLPFFVKDKNGFISLQIVEGAQIDKRDLKNQELIDYSTYFNPVFMVLSMKTFKNSYFDLNNFVSKDCYIITEKKFNEKKIKVLEHPGLWNGGMYYWNSIFVEVPRHIFSPVKTVMDLLKEEHKV